MSSAISVFEAAIPGILRVSTFYSGLITYTHIHKNSFKFFR